MVADQLKKVSIIIPTYKRSESITTIIDCVLEQTYSNIEIIVVDDNGEGAECQLETEERLREYIDSGKIIYIKHSVNKNGSAARNTGLKVCKGEYINFLDDDDIFLPNKIACQVEVLSHSAPIVGATYSNMIKIERERITGKIKRKEYHFDKNGNILVPYLLGHVIFNTSAILFKREALELLNGFDESWRRHQDYELMTRFFQHFTILSCNKEPLMIYDVSRERINIPNPKKQYDLEERFLRTFEPLIPPNDFPKVWKKMWMSCCSISILSGDYNIFRRSLKKLKELNRLGFKDNIKILKWFLMSLISRFINK